MFVGVAKHTDKFILHKVFFKTDVEEQMQERTRKEMSKVLSIGFFPEMCEI